MKERVIVLPATLSGEAVKLDSGYKDFQLLGSWSRMSNTSPTKTT